MEYGKDVKDNDFDRIAFWIANAWDPDTSTRIQALQKLSAKHIENVRNLQQQGKFDHSTEIKLWNPCVTFCYPPSEMAMVKEIERDSSERARRDLRVRDANIVEWRIWKGFGKGPWSITRKATPADLATQSRWVQLNWEVQRSHGVFCPKYCLCPVCTNNGGLLDMQVFKLRRKRNPTASVVELEATISAMKELRRFSADILRSLKRRTNMVSDTRREIEDCARAAWTWALDDEVELSADNDAFEERKRQLVSLVQRKGNRLPYELELDAMDVERRKNLHKHFLQQDLVKVADPSTGKCVIGKIKHTVRSQYLGAGHDPDWAYIKGTWYRDDEVEAAATHEVSDYQRSEFDSDVEAGSLAGGSDSDVADFGPEHDQSPSCDHAAGFVSHRRICERESHATRYEIANIQAQATTCS